MASRINVLLLITELNVGGAERVVEQIATGLLSKNRYRVLVACLYDAGPIADDITAAGVRVVDLGMRGKWDAWVVYRLFRLLRSEEIHVLHAHLFHANLLGVIAGKMAGVPVIVATRQSVDIGGRWREWINHWAMRLPDKVVAVSEEVRQAENLRSRTESSKIITIPNSVPFQVFDNVNQSKVSRLRRNWDFDNGIPVIGTVGRFVEPKGYPHLLDAMVRIQAHLPDVKVLLVGDGVLRRPMEEKAEALGLSDAVIFTGIRRDVPEILALLDVFVLPSLWEGLPIALLEAMAAGLPVVATRVGGVPEVVVDGVTGLLVPPRDPEALSEAILTLLQDPDLRQKMGQAGQDRVREYFSVERMVKRTENLYASLLKEKGY
jgi:glycosyltransferase involved in cell wall biosynthesis